MILASRHFPLSLYFLIVIFCARPAFAQGTKTDYERANRLHELARGRLDSEVRPHWLTPHAFWYQIQRGDRRRYHWVDCQAKERRDAFDHTKLAEAISTATKTEVAADRLDVQWLAPDPEGKHLTAHVQGKTWRIKLEDYSLEEVKAERPAELKPPGRDRSRSRGDQSRAESPDGKWRIEIRDHNVHLVDVKSKDAAPLTTDGSPDDHYTGEVYWAPDSQHVIVMRRRPEQQHPVQMVEAAPKDQLQPKLFTHQYLKPGDRIAQTRPALFDVAAKKQTPIDDRLFDNPWSIRHCHWLPSSKRFVFLYNQRGHQVLRLIAVEADTGESGAIINEQCKTFFDYAHKEFTQYLDDTHEVIWMSERDGWNHLYLIDIRTGDVKNQITQGQWVVRGVDRVDVGNRQIWFRAGGVYPSQDPYYVHIGRVNFDGSGLTWLTDGNGTHEIQHSPERHYIIDRYSRVDMPPVSEVRSAEDGKLICEVERSDWKELLETGWRAPERLTFKGRDGKTDIYGVLWRPTNFDKSKKYPVIESIYAGPHSAFCPKRFRSHYKEQSLAELGFVVVKMDGMGTSHRSKAFHDVCWKNLGDSGFPDRIAWIKTAAKKYPWMDLSRVGIYGGSAGGQSSTRAMLAHGDFYHVAVSDCGCHDNRMDKIWWNELWMSWPIGPHYEEQSNVTQAHRLQGKLLLIVGGMDRNVDPASTMQVVDALIKADKDFDLLVVPGGGHGIAESPYGTRRRRDFFVRHLLGVEPRSK